LPKTGSPQCGAIFTILWRRTFRRKFARRIKSLRSNRDDGQHFIVRADKKLTAFVELESVIRRNGELS